MNSKQRRKEKRDIDKNYHKVHLTISPGMNWIAWNDQVAEMVRWIRKYTSRDCFLQKNRWESSTFYFSDAKDATHFTLRWS
jgi:hypothetical protein